MVWLQVEGLVQGQRPGAGGGAPLQEGGAGPVPGYAVVLEEAFLDLGGGGLPGEALQAAGGGQSALAGQGRGELARGGETRRRRPRGFAVVGQRVLQAGAGLEGGRRIRRGG